ncbi:DUF4115 domain-containing protein [Alteromonas sp. ASW11-19]|uniref:DUF4115 domain-containing protein n=1 Tax=Alteromonas salexigens TaxID=2982530 RepID=A0ABT2VRZ6_9ALTE|nr:RodZ domain-containing protein [Alteromonas salexigens]MCU7555683.1 DUF4115 domain-containing protein [Alteromonas salexigens]
MVSEEQQPNPEQHTDTPPAASPGKMLREGREAQGLTQDEIASRLFLKASQIDDIENDRLDDSMSVTFTKGYVRNYAKQLGLDSQTVVAEFERCHDTPRSSANLQSFSRRVAKQAHDDRWMMVTWVIALLLIAGVVAWWYQQSDDAQLGQEQTAVETPVSAKEASERDSDAVQPLGGSGQIPVSETRRTDTGTADSSSPAESDNSADTLNQMASPEETTPAIQATDGSEEAALTAAESTPASNNQGGQAQPINMAFTFGEDCWVNIKDATGEAIAYGVKQAGRVMQLEGVPPVEVTLGAPDNVQITVNGEPVDMSSYQNGRTARFSLPIQE